MVAFTIQNMERVALYNGSGAVPVAGQWIDKRMLSKRMAKSGRFVLLKSVILL